MFQGVILKEEQREEKRENEKKNDTGRPSFGERGPQLYFQKELLYLDLHIEGNERCKVTQSQPKHYIYFVFIKTRVFSAYLSHKQCCVHYLLALEGLWTFYDPFLIKAAQPENLFSGLKIIMFIII